MEQEELNSFFIKKIKELEKRIEELESKAHTKTIEEAVKEHDRNMSLLYSNSVMAEKQKQGKMIWSRENHFPKRKKSIKKG